MRYEISESKLTSILAIATESAVNKALTELGLKKSQICQIDAFRRYGEKRVLRWKREGKITPNKSGRKIFYLVNELEKLKSLNELY